MEDFSISCVFHRYFYSYQGEEEICVCFKLIRTEITKRLNVGLVSLLCNNNDKNSV